MPEPSQKLVLIKNKILINITGRPSLVQRKLFNIFLYIAYNKLGDFKHETFKTTIPEIAELMGYEGKINYGRFKKDLIGLMQTVVEWDILDENGNINEEDFSLSTLLSSVKIKKGVIEYRIPLELRKLLIENNQYVKINLQMQRVFTSKYSISLYEVAKEFFREKDKLGETPWIEIERLKKLFGLDDQDYQDFKIFNRDLIQKATKEINDRTDLHLDLELKKVSKKVSHIKFKIRYNKNPDFEKELSLLPEQEKKQEYPESKIAKDLLSFGVSKDKVNDWFKKFPEEYIQSKLDLVLDKMKQGKIKVSPTGFLVKAIEANYDEGKVSIDTLLEQATLEARKLNPETILVDPTSFNTQESFEDHIEELKTQYFTPRWVASMFESASQIWNKKKEYNLSQI